MREPARKMSVKTGETIDAVRADIERKKRDAADMRAARRANAGLDPSKVVDDFYAENFTDITDPEVKQREKEREKERRKEEKRAVKEDQPSVFDMILHSPDEISPDTCRFWDSKTKEKLDKDRFRRDLGNVEDAYNEILARLLGE